MQRLAKQTDKLTPQLALMADLRDRIVDPDYTPPRLSAELDPEIYLDPARLEDEQKKLFQTRPIIVGHIDQLKQAGDYFTHDLLGAPLLIVRGQDAEIRGFFNVCRHRGMRLVPDQEAGRKPGFVCPYHNWAYDLDGSLKNVPLAESFEGHDLSCRGLKPVPLEVHAGFIWVQPHANSALSVEDWLGTVTSDLNYFDTANHVVFKQTTTSRKTNWKLIIEAFQDGYHVTRLHKKTVGPFFGDSQFATERTNEHLRAVVGRQEFNNVINQPTDEWDPRLHVSFAHLIFPNSIIVVHPDYISHLGLYPVGVDETAITHTCLIPKTIETEKERDHWERSFDLIENGVFQSEDYFVCEHIQSGLASGANEKLIIGGYEIGIQLFHDILGDVMREPDSDLR